MHWCGCKQLNISLASVTLAARGTDTLQSTQLMTGKVTAGAHLAAGSHRVHMLAGWTWSTSKKCHLIVCGRFFYKS